MYFPYFIAYIALGFLITIPVFLWALKSGQFKDQQRARFLPLEDDADTPVVRASRISRYEIGALVFLAVSGLITSASIVVFALFSAGR
ncbi:cbb3-type cytochrome oxidase assembly protein CcoS [Desulfococcus sp.]|uniref:cbb3-type cytochrome oxidase assembly protein CcoS n=1 Tax=Desulfococcus sp. TaxID=2025834 RepID=UPI0035936C73